MLFIGCLTSSLRLAPRGWLARSSAGAQNLRGERTGLEGLAAAAKEEDPANAHGYTVHEVHGRAIGTSPAELSVVGGTVPSMMNWREFERREPEFAALVAARFAAHKHKTMATIRADGGPRICGTEAELVDGDLWLGGMTRNRRFADLRRDPRVEVHSGSDDPDVWSGDARVAGVAVEVTDPAEQQRFHGGAGELAPGQFELFRIDLRSAVLVRLDDAREHLLIDSWDADRGRAATVRR
jgi:hypothetical protein